MTGLAALLIFVGLFLLGGVISFWRQGLPKAVIVLAGIGAVLALAAGILRLEVWQ
ncbi:hypothetical protein JJV70_18385 [Streptomyces sp. JJ66]|uniref:hypothetical protein n=1 Tax=Streptomyces sp. JJ66 TaxID=2803843 RepID=UPI001C589BFB|nr:hypothetical protein [Streptomyces sp. JJ66]MBW1604037.1 hypothetical protein [Streptomyces sp. JJ66]